MKAIAQRFRDEAIAKDLHVRVFNAKYAIQGIPVEINETGMLFQDYFEVHDVQSIDAPPKAVTKITGLWRFFPYAGLTVLELAHKPKERGT